jgi:hypothetical protein
MIFLQNNEKADGVGAPSASLNNPPLLGGIKNSHEVLLRRDQI